MSHPNRSTVMELVYRPSQEAIDRALHRSDPTAWHKRLGDYPCPFCPSEHEKRYQEIRGLAEMADLTLEDWQAKLIAQIPPSAALVKYLEENELEPDVPLTEDPEQAARDQVVEDRITYGYMTTKELRPLASAAGMKGARVAKKDELIEFLVSQS